MSNASNASNTPKRNARSTSPGARPAGKRLAYRDTCASSAATPVPLPVLTPAPAIPTPAPAIPTPAPAIPTPAPAIPTPALAIPSRAAAARLRSPATSPPRLPRKAPRASRARALRRNGNISSVARELFPAPKNSFTMTFSNGQLSMNLAFDGACYGGIAGAGIAGAGIAGAGIAGAGVADTAVSSDSLAAIAENYPFSPGHDQRGVARKNTSVLVSCSVTLPLVDYSSDSD